jgi:hypothetical protein
MNLGGAAAPPCRRHEEFCSAPVPGIEFFAAGIVFIN